MGKTRKINLALQGGGAHGAFTWGVLDRLLEDETIEVAGISGTSAGAMNGAAYKSGWVRNGRAGAKESLDWLWGQMGAVNDLRMPGWMKGMVPSAGAMSSWIAASPAFRMGEAITQAISPYAMGPFYMNPLRQIVEKFEFGFVCSGQEPALFIGATNVRTGKIKVFSGDDVTADAILASACLPDIFQAVEIDGEAYWDGGYSGNPPFFPLYNPGLPDDIVVVNINPLYRPDIPMSSQDIHDRINEISFNSSLLRDLRAIDFVQRLIADGAVEQGKMKNVLVHMISDDELMQQLSAATKMVPTPTVLAQLKEAGRAAADTFLAEHSQDLNVRSSCDLRELFG